VTLRVVAVERLHTPRAAEAIEEATFVLRPAESEIKQNRETKKKKEKEKAHQAERTRNAGGNKTER